MGCLLISFCFGSEILKKIGPPQPPKNPKKRLMDFLDGITFQRFELKGWGLVQCLLISFCFGSEILKKIGLPQLPKNAPKPPKTPLNRNLTIIFSFFSLGLDLPNHFR